MLRHSTWNDSITDLVVATIQKHRKSVLILHSTAADGGASYSLVRNSVDANVLLSAAMAQPSVIEWMIARQGEYYAGFRRKRKFIFL